MEILEVAFWKFQKFYLNTSRGNAVDTRLVLEGSYENSRKPF